MLRESERSDPWRLGPATMELGSMGERSPRAVVPRSPTGDCCGGLFTWLVPAGLRRSMAAWKLNGSEECCAFIRPPEGAHL